MNRPCSLLTVVALQALQGCYMYVPVQSSVPPTGERVVLQISDQGRVALGERLGPGVSRIQGRVTNVADQELSMNVSSVGYVSGENSLWSGESVSLNREYVSTVQVRQLSKGRTWVAVGVTTAVIGAFIATHGFGVFLSDLPPGESDGGDGPITLRFRIGLPF